MKKRWAAFLLCAGMIINSSICMAGEMEEKSDSVQTETETKNQASAEKTRVIITQDGEVDDMNSLIHLLLYANDLDIAGIVQTSSSLHYSGDEETEALRWPGTDWMYEFLDAYAKVYENLAKHDEAYPSPEALKAVTVVGNVKNVDEMAESTEGSRLIRDCIMDDDERTLYIAVGGGANTLGAALKSIEEEYAGSDEWDAVYKKVCDKVVINTWGFQDSVYKEYISVSWEDIKVVDISGASLSYGYSYAKTDMTVAARKKMEGSWMYENLVNGHGPLLDKYVTWGDGTYLEGEAEQDQFGSNEELVGSTNWWGGKLGLMYNRYDFLSEGDSLDWMYLLPTGLRSLEDESYGGWGGRFVQKQYSENENVQMYVQPENENSLLPWIEAIQDDFAARADWCVTDKYEDANHTPAVTVKEGLDLSAAPGEVLTLHGEAEDPDGDEVQITWWQYADADTYEEEKDDKGQREALEVEVSDSVPGEAYILIPEDAKSGDTIHLIAEAKDSGEHNLRSYQRVIITVK